VRLAPVQTGITPTFAGVICLITALTTPFGWSQTASISPPSEEIAPQSGQSAATAEVERVIVTGSHLPTAAEVGPNPVQELDRDYIDKAPERTAEALLRDLPVASANGVPLSNNGTGFAPGASSVSLRGFDASATLVLIDGRRVAPYPVAAGAAGAPVGTQTFIDLNSIPLAAVESFEILKDGASTTYGADAVAGVVNIKLRHDYRGAELRVEVGDTLDKDNGEFLSSLVFGVGDGDNDISGVLNYYHRNAILNRDRGFSNYTQELAKSTASNPGQFQITRDAALAAGVPVSELPNGASFFGRPPSGTNGLASPNDYLYYSNLQHLFNFNEFASSFPESERYGGFANFDHKICGDQLMMYGDFFYQTVKTEYELAQSPVSFQRPGIVSIGIPPHAPGPTLGGPTYESTNLPMGSFNPFNPFQQIIAGSSRYRLVDFPDRIVDDTTEAFMTTLGLKGDKLFDGSWGYDAGFRYSQIRDAATGNYVGRSSFGRILNAADPIFDPTSDQFIGTTVPYNPFGDYHRPIASNAATINFATVHPKDLQLSKLTTLDLNVYTTSLFKLPAGPVGLAFGGQFRREVFDQKPDQLNLNGDVIGLTGNATSTNAGRKSFGIYAETVVPVFSPEMKVPLIHLMEFTASGRFEDYLNNDTNIMVPKVGVRWQPLDDSLTLRATWGEGFREPSLLELYNSPSSSFVNVFDRRNPGGPADVTDVAALLLSNPRLAPEDSRNFSAGFVYTPKFISGLTLTTDFFVIERHDVVGAPEAQDVLNREDHLLPGEEIIRDDEGFLVQITAPFENLGQERAEGFDFGIQYQGQTKFGTFTWLTDATYLESFRASITRTAPALELRSQPTDNSSSDAYLKWKARSRLDWSLGGFTLSATVSYFDGFHEIIFVDPFFPDKKKEHWVKQTFFFDAQASYQFRFASVLPTTTGSGPKDSKQITQSFDASLPCWKRLLDNTTLTIGCNNIFGQDPPRAFGFFDQNPINYPGSIYSAVGRFVYASVTKKF
jgi:iron complex outermembrane recepter protein